MVSIHFFTAARNFNRYCGPRVPSTHYHLLMQISRIAAAAVALCAAAAYSQEQVVKIGHVAPTSGAIAHLGKDLENGARMAIEELNAKGVVIGGRKVKFVLQAEDDAADPKQGTATAQKLVDEKVSGVVGHLNSGTTIPASRIYSEAGIPQISPTATNPKYTRQGYKTAFRLVADDAQLGGTLGRFSVQTLKGKRFAVIDDRTAYGQGVADEFIKGVKGAGGQVVGQEFTSDKATDFSAILTKLKAAQPDVVFFGGMDAVAGPMIRQMKQLGLNAKFVGGDGMCSEELAKLAGGELADQQVWCAEAGGVEGEARQAMTDFHARFKKKYGHEVKQYAPYAYEAVNIMVNAMVKAQSSDPRKYLPVLAKTEGYKGVIGNVAFDAKGDVKNGTLTLYTFKGLTRYSTGVVH